MTMVASPRWYVVQTHVHSENKAAALCSARIYDVCCRVT